MVRYYKGLYFIGGMSDADAERVLNLRSLTAVENLRHCIYDLTDEEITDLVAMGERGVVTNLSKQYKVGTLRDEQTIGVAFMYFAKAALLGDDVGLGKTVQVAGLLNILQAAKNQKYGKYVPLNYLFLTESTSVMEIRRKLLRFTGRYNYLLVDGTQGSVHRYISRLAKPDFNWDLGYAAVGTHSLLHSTEFMSFCATHTFDIVIYDESSSARNATGSSSMYRNLQLLLSKCDYKVLLNATPVEVALRDLYNQFKLLDANYLPTLRDFEALFCKKTKIGCRYVIEGFKNLDVFKRATTLRYMARTRKQLGANYTDNKAHLFILDLAPIQKQLQKRTSLYQQLYDFPPSIMFDVDDILPNNPKIWTTLAILHNFDLKKEKVMIYCNYVACQASLKKTLEEYGYSVEIMNGSTSAKQREKILNAFHNGVVNILLTNTRRSLDLQDCDHCIIYTIDTSPAKTVQVEGRLTRDFDVCGKNIYVLCMAGRELKTLYGVVQQRAVVSEKATTENNSLYISLLLRDDKEMYHVTADAYTGSPETYKLVADKNMTYNNAVNV